MDQSWKNFPLERSKTSSCLNFFSCETPASVRSDWGTDKVLSLVQSDATASMNWSLTTFGTEEQPQKCNDVRFLNVATEDNDAGAVLSKNLKIFYMQASSQKAVRETINPTEHS